jgi:hypothetical protein
MSARIGAGALRASMRWITASLTPSCLSFTSASALVSNAGSAASIAWITVASARPPRTMRTTSSLLIGAASAAVANRASATKAARSPLMDTIALPVC